MSRSRAAPGRRGLTLIEIALALSILALMATLTWGGIARSFDAYETVTDIDHRYHQVRVAMNRMAKEISMAFITNIRRERGRERIWETIFKAERGSDFYRIDFTAFAHDILRADAKESDQCEIGYYGAEDPENRGQMNLMRREDPRIDREPDEGGRAYVLAENIKSFKLRFWDDRQQDWAEEWDTEDGDFAGRLPSIVEIRMVTTDEDGKDLTFVTKTRINLTRELGTL
ncbi:MAG: prepilin-type N-terminal cleavage/methylation domain-containing protein [Myxococcales bacterium]|nr:prepilin-type N-terminal cleavage/methylation domain-containing protein [Myxococcales bacterium]